MKFDFIIGNPPYQEEAPGTSTSDKPIYHLFMDESYKIADAIELITPGRFLFDAGATPSAWNEKMLEDEHLKVLYYEQNSSKVFSNTDIKGGVVVTLRDKRKNFGAIEVFSPFDELNTIREKVSASVSKGSLVDIIFNQNKFNLEKLYNDHPKYKTVIGSNGQDKRFRNNAFEKISLFSEEKPKVEAISVLGLIKNKRVYRFFPLKYTDTFHENLFQYKVLVPRANGTGALGEVISTPLIGEPLIGYTQSFIGIGSFESENEAKNALKYIKTKFARTLLGILKITQDNPPEKWRFVPLQNFTNKSDINWSRSIPEIDKQLYKKYGLDANEIAFIESHVKEMD